MRRILFLLLLLLGALFITNLIWSFRRLDAIVKSNFENLPKETDTYSEIFNQKLNLKLKPSLTFFRKSNNPTATFYDDVYSYRLLITKYKLADKHLNLQTVIQISTNDIPVPRDEAYDASIKTSGFKFFHTFEKIAIINKLHLYASGENFKVQLKSDTIINYSINLKNLKLGINEANKLINFIEPIESSNLKNYVEISIIKKDDSVFVIYKFNNDLNRYDANNHLYKLFIPITNDN